MAKRHPYTQLTLKLLRKGGWQCGITEHWNSFVGIRQDLHGFIDIIATTDGVTAGVQCTSAACRSARRKKILASVEACKWSRGRLILLITWSKKKSRWVPNIEPIGEHDFDQAIRDQCRPHLALVPRTPEPSHRSKKCESQELDA